MPQSQIENAVSQEYDKLASTYDSRWQNYIDQSLSFLLNSIEILPQESVLDLACGTGELAKLILAKNPQQQITGIDLSKDMLEVAKKKLKAYPNISLYNTSAASLPIADKSFDIVVCANAFHFFEFPQQVLAEIKRVLKPGGKVIIVDWCRDYILMKIIDVWLKITDPAHQKCYSAAEFNQILETAGFDIIKDDKIRFGMIWELIAIVMK